MDESTLMGAGGGFADAIRKRDAAKFKREQEREMQIREKREGDRERLEERKRKEEGTMAMYVACPCGCTWSCDAHSEKRNKGYSWRYTTELTVQVSGDGQESIWLVH